MERRERYDPEDIERLLRERRFDELLEAERAYVLRHLSGPEEYAAMRALVRQLADEAADHRPIEPDPAVRANVLQAFRAARTPQWRIWLNSVGAAMWPAQGPAWRPALAFGMVALLLGVGITVVRQIDPEPQKLAEVRSERPTDSVPAPAPPATQEAPLSPPTDDAPAGGAVAPPAVASGTTHMDQAAPPPPAAAAGPTDEVVVDAIAPAAVAEQEVLPAVDDHFMEQYAAAKSERPAVVPSAAPPRKESARDLHLRAGNQVVAEAAPELLSNSLADAPSLLLLVASGW